jgi:hypothetical protein
VDHVRDPVPRREALVVVVVARKHEVDAVTLEKRHPSRDDRGIAEVAAAGVGRVVEETIFQVAVDAARCRLSQRVCRSPTEFELRTKRSKFGRER